MKKPVTVGASGVARGKFANLLKQVRNVVLLDPELMPCFPDSAALNRALRAFIAIEKRVQSAATSAMDIDLQLNLRSRADV